MSGLRGDGPPRGVHRPRQRAAPARPRRRPQRRLPLPAPALTPGFRPTAPAFCPGFAPRARLQMRGNLVLAALFDFGKPIAGARPPRTASRRPFRQGGHHEARPVRHGGRGASGSCSPKERPLQEDLSKIRHRMPEVRLKVDRGRVVGAIGDCSHLQEVEPTKTCRSCRTCAFPGDAQRPSRLLQFSRARRVDDVLIATGNCPEKYPELRTDLASSPSRSPSRTSSRRCATAPPSEASPRSSCSPSCRSLPGGTSRGGCHTETARRSCADHRLNRRPLFDQVLSLYRVLCLGVSTHREEHAKLVEEMALEPPQK